MGFIGSRLWERLEDNHTLNGIDIKSCKNILTAELPEVDVVVHLAAKAGVRESVENPKA